jgi:cytochrome c556
MNKLAWIAVPALLLVAGCSKKQEPQQPAKPTVLHEVMKNEIDNRADDVWAVGNAHMDKDAGLDGKSMSDADWAKLAATAQHLKEGAQDLATLPDPITVVAPGGKIAYQDDPGGDKPEAVQHNVDQDPQGLRDLANALSQHMDDLIAAANKHDAKAAGDLLNGLDGVCESCHVKYWYPSQKALIDSINTSEAGG